MKYKGYLIIATIMRIAGDIIALYLAFLLSFWLRFYSHLIPVFFGIPALGLYQDAFVVGLLLILVVFKAFGLYNEKNLYKFHNEAFLIIKAFTTGVILIMALTFMHRAVTFSRLVVGFFWLIGMVLLIIVRYVVASVEPYICRWRGEFKKALILGINDNAFRLIKYLRGHPKWGYEITGFISKDPVERMIPEIDGIPVVGTLEELGDILKRIMPDELIVTITGLPHKVMVDIIKDCEKNLVTVKLVPDMFEIITSKVDIYDVDGVPLLGIKELPLEYAWNRFIKRAFDIIGSIIGLIVTSPLFLIIPVLIKLTSKGRIFYKQERCGEDGRVFTLYKFRTMYEDAESQTGPVWAVENDPRCTRVGRVLRRLNLDELPQFWNVLKGDMSLVGPRPERPDFVEKFKENIPRYMSRHLIKAGLTGWAQVNGLRGNTPLNERIKYDLYYIENWSIWFDIRIILMTFFSNKNAY